SREGVREGDPDREGGARAAVGSTLLRAAARPRGGVGNTAGVDGGCLYDRDMAQCTAPVRGHRSAAAAAACPACRWRSSSYRSYTAPASSYRSGSSSYGGGGSSR